MVLLDEKQTFSTLTSKVRETVRCQRKSLEKL